MKSAIKLLYEMELMKEKVSEKITSIENKINERVDGVQKDVRKNSDRVKLLEDKINNKENK